MRILCSRKRLLILGLLVLLFIYHKLKLHTDNYSVIWFDLKNEAQKKVDFKYILLWTSHTNVPFVYMGKGRQGFINRNCPYSKCVVTSNRSYLSDLSKFDVIAFSGTELNRLRDFPMKRSPHQKFVYANIESAYNYPLCADKFDGYFNWTWTYKLDSEVRWGYMVIRNKYNTLIGPNKQMNWMKLKDMVPISDKYKERLRNKTKAVAWFVSNCYSKSYRETFVQLLRKDLDKFKLNIDIYGRCGKLNCSRRNSDCDKLIRDNYYFYLSFETSFSEDYVTEKLLRALKNDAVPIVYGGANYTRFMPDGIYLNAYELGPKNLAIKINALISSPNEYFEYFKWKNHYSYYEMDLSVETNPYCLFCAILHNKSMVKKTSIYNDFRKWWNPPNICII